MGKLTFPLVVRKWKQSDRFKPLGMRGYKKISDFLIDEKISVLDKEGVFVITSDEEICCIIGKRIDERFKITSSTQQVFHIEQMDN